MVTGSDDGRVRRAIANLQRGEPILSIPVHHTDLNRPPITPDLKRYDKRS
jgi:hypothetical protein